jgi:hypothetical protein
VCTSNETAPFSFRDKNNHRGIIDHKSIPSSFWACLQSNHSSIASLADFLPITMTTSQAAGKKQEAEQYSEISLPLSCPLLTRHNPIPVKTANRCNETHPSERVIPLKSLTRENMQPISKHAKLWTDAKKEQKASEILRPELGTNMRNNGMGDDGDTEACYMLETFKKQKILEEILVKGTMWDEQTAALKYNDCHVHQVLQKQSDAIPDPGKRLIKPREKASKAVWNPARGRRGGSSNPGRTPSCEPAICGLDKSRIGRESLWEEVQLDPLEFLDGDWNWDEIFDQRLLKCDDHSHAYTVDVLGHKNIHQHTALSLNESVDLNFVDHWQDWMLNSEKSPSMVSSDVCLMRV